MFSNVVGNYNNQFRYKFPNNGIRILEGSEVCLANTIIPYSFYYSGSTPTTITVTLNDGFYTVNDINNALNTLFQYNGLFFLHKPLQQMDFKPRLIFILFHFEQIRTIIQMN